MTPHSPAPPSAELAETRLHEAHRLTDEALLANRRGEHARAHSLIGGAIAAYVVADDALAALVPAVGAGGGATILAAARGRVRDMVASLRTSEAELARRVIPQAEGRA